MLGEDYITNPITKRTRICIFPVTSSLAPNQLFKIISAQSNWRLYMFIAREVNKQLVVAQVWKEVKWTYRGAMLEVYSLRLP